MFSADGGIGFSPKMPSWRSVCVFFGLAKAVFFLVSGVLALDGALKEVERREPLQNNGFRSDLVSFYVLNSLWTSWTALILHNVYENSFDGPYKYIFSEVRIFDQIRFGRQKTAWGCRAEVISKMTFFTFFQARTNL